MLTERERIVNIYMYVYICKCMNKTPFYIHLRSREGARTHRQLFLDFLEVALSGCTEYTCFHMHSTDIFIPAECWQSLADPVADKRLIEHIRKGRAMAVGRYLDSSDAPPSLNSFLNVIDVRDDEKRLALLRTPKVLSFWLCWNTLLGINYFTSKILANSHKPLSSAEGRMLYWYDQTFKSSWESPLPGPDNRELRFWFNRQNLGVSFMRDDPYRLCALARSYDDLRKHWAQQGVTDETSRQQRKALNKLWLRCRNLSNTEQPLTVIPEFGEL